MHYYGSQIGKRKSQRKPLKAARDLKSRLKIIKFFTIIWVVILLTRLFSLQITDNSKWQEWASKQHISEVQLAGARGVLYDRNKKPMAVSVESESIYVRPYQIENKIAVRDILADSLELDPDFVEYKLGSTQPFVWIKRQIPKVHAKKVLQHEIKGIGSIVESKRYYPFNQAASALIGRVGIDGNGLSGIEASYEKVLNPNKKTITFLKDALGNSIQHSDKLSKEVLRGKAITLTIDAEFQRITDRALEKTLLEHKAKRAMAVMLNADTGEVLSMSQAPAINHNTESITSREDLTNFLVEAAYEPGSTMKPIVTAMILENAHASADEIINTENGKFRVGRHTIKDTHPSDRLSVKHVVVQSSNIGMTKLGMRAGKEALYNSLRDFGFGERTNLALPGEAPGILRHVKTWAEVDVATHSFGQGVAVSALQMVRAFAAVVNGGYLPALSLIKTQSSGEIAQVISEETSQVIQDILVAVVEDEEGTGSKAQIPGVRIGGKTGTAQKAKTDGKGYQKGVYMASFIGFADAQELGIDSKLVLLVMVDEPSAGSIYGGTVAAPAFREIINECLHILVTRDNLGTVKEKPQLIKASYRF